MNTEFKEAIESLLTAHADFKEGLIKSVQHGDEREAAICKGVMALAVMLDSTIEPVTHFSSRAELRIVGTFSAKFAEALNTHANPRTGVIPGAVMREGVMWCYVNHFDAERLILAYAG